MNLIALSVTMLWFTVLSFTCKYRATVKAGTQEHGMELGTEVMWFHTGNYTEMMQEV